MISDELRSHLAATVADQRVADVRIGLGYTAIMLEDGNVGLAYTFRENAPKGCSVFQGKRPLAGRMASELLEYLGSREGVESAIGLAVANALANRPRPDQSEGDILDALSLDAQDRVGMVGFFAPLVEPLEQRVRELLIFERDTERSERALPAEDARTCLPSCDVAVITSTALILGEMDGLLEAAATCRVVALVGASTPLISSLFAPYGVKQLSGVTVTDGPGVLQTVSEGGGMGFFGKRVRKVNVTI